MPAPPVHNNAQGGSVSVKVGSGKQAASRLAKTARVVCIDPVQSESGVGVARGVRGRGAAAALGPSEFSF